jgi:hypothetical protein
MRAPIREEFHAVFLAGLLALVVAPAAFAKGSWKYASADHTQVQIDWQTDSGASAQFEVFTLTAPVASATCSSGAAAQIGQPDGNPNQFECKGTPAGTDMATIKMPMGCTDQIKNKDSFDGSTYVAQADITSANSCGSPPPAPPPPTLTATKYAFDVSTGDKIIGGQRFPKGTVIRYDIEVTKGGGQSASSVNVSDPLPANCEDAPDYKPFAVDPATHGVAGGYFGYRAGAKSFISTDPLQPGSKIVVSFYCRTGDGFIDNTAFVTADNVSGRVAPSFGTIVSLSTDAVREGSADAGGASGTAGPPGKTARAAAATLDPRITALEKLSRVEVAFQKLGTGPCQWLKGKRAKFTKVAANKGKCDKPIWLRASGTRKWRYKLLQRLPRGHYVLLARAVDVGGVSNNSFSPQQHNLRNFTVS